MRCCRPLCIAPATEQICDEDQVWDFCGACFAEIEQQLQTLEIERRRLLAQGMPEPLVDRRLEVEWNRRR